MVIGCSRNVNIDSVQTILDLKKLCLVIRISICEFHHIGIPIHEPHLKGHKLDSKQCRVCATCSTARTDYSLADLGGIVNLFIPMEF